MPDRNDTSPHESALCAAPRWRHAGPARPDTRGLPDPRFQTDYALAYDPGAGHVVYLQRLGFDTLGPLWHLENDIWHLASHAEFTVGGTPCSRLALTHDPQRDAMVAWQWVRHADARAVPVGVTLAADGPALLPIISELPDAACDERFSAVFAHDPERGVTVAVTGHEIWELDRHGYWTRRRTREPGSQENDWPGYELIGAAYDRPRQRVVVWALAPAADSRILGRVSVARARRFYMFAWDGQAIVHMGAAGLPTDAQARRHQDQQDPAIVVCEHPAYGLMAYVPGERGFYRMSRTGWLPFTLEKTQDAIDGFDESIHLPALDGPPPPEAYPGAAPPAHFSGARAAYDARGQRFLLGPGAYPSADDPGRGVRARHVFYQAHARAWSMREYQRPEVPEPSDIEFVLAGDEGPIAIAGSSAVYAFDPGRLDPWTPTVQANDTEVRGRVSAAFHGRDREVWIVSEYGEVARLYQASRASALPEYDAGRLRFIPARNRRWQRMLAPFDLSECADTVFRISEPRDPLLAVYDRRSDQVVVWRQDLPGDAGRTLIWPVGADGWTQTADAPSGEVRHAARSLMYYDTVLERVVRLGAREFAIFDDHRWRVFRHTDPVLADVHPWHRIAMHDARSGETLLLDLAARRIVRFDLGGSRFIADHHWPEGFHVTERAEHRAPGFPFRAMGYHERAGRLLCHSRSDAWENYELDMGPVLAAARSLGPRMSYPAFLARER